MKRSQTIKLYGRMHASRRRETEFGHFLAEALGTKLIRETLPVDASLLDVTLPRDELVASLLNDTALPPERRERCMHVLRRLPNRLIVADRASRISFDFVAVARGTHFFWEFHEEQHRELTVSRPSAVFSPGHTRFSVPRYLQRLCRDVWRIRACENLTIVWCDWFAANRASYAPKLQRGFHEHASPDSFSFRAFCSV